MGSRFLCALLLGLTLCACTEPIPAEAPEMRDAHTSDTTFTVTPTIKGEGWNDSVTIGF